MAMIKKHSLIFVLFLLFLQFLQGQNKNTALKISSWEVDYNIYFQQDEADSPKDSIGEMTSMIMKALMQNDDGPMLFCYITDQKIRVEQKGMMGYTVLMDKKDSVSYMLDEDFKTAYRNSSDIETIVEGDSIVVIDPEDFNVTFEKEQKEILGYSCKKAVFSNAAISGATMVAWYTEEIPKLYWGKYAYLEKLPGCVLQLYTKTDHKKVGITAHQIRKINMSPSRFEVPKEYKIEEAY